MTKPETLPNSSDNPALPGRDAAGSDLKFYGRRKGKKMRDARLGALESVYPSVAISLSSLPLSRLAGEGRGEGESDWKDARHAAASKAKALRKDPTDAEKIFWQKVRDRQIDGYKFKRQFPVGPFIVDFACPAQRLVVEIDGGQHDENAKDTARTHKLEQAGYTILRFWNNDVLGNIDGVLDTLTLTLSRKREREIAHLPDSIDPASFFDFPVKDVWLEVGFGNGEHLLHHALNNPDIGMIGCEPFINGIAALCTDIKKHGVKNIRIFGDDARLFLPRLKTASLGRVFVLNSDPWPKKRHAKRRFIQQETLAEIHRLLKDGAEFRMSSDHPVLIDWQLRQALMHGGFSWQAKCAADWQTRPADLPETRYQKKGLREGRDTAFLNFRRI